MADAKLPIGVHAGPLFPSAKQGEVQGPGFERTTSCSCQEIMQPMPREDGNHYAIQPPSGISIIRHIS